MQRINITLPDQLVDDLRQSIPPRSRSKFIAAAVSEKLENKKNLKTDLIKSLKANRDFYQMVAKEWKATESDVWPM